MLVQIVDCRQLASCSALPSQLHRKRVVLLILPQVHNSRFTQNSSGLPGCRGGHHGKVAAGPLRHQCNLGRWLAWLAAQQPYAPLQLAGHWMPRRPGGDHVSQGLGWRSRNRVAPSAQMYISRPQGRLVLMAALAPHKRVISACRPTALSALQHDCWRAEAACGGQDGCCA